jgi:hypothetical protein
LADHRPRHAAPSRDNPFLTGATVMAHRHSPAFRLPIVLLAVAVCLLGSNPKALALATERFGNDPLSETFGLDMNALGLANLKTRVYYYEVNANPTFYYRGDTDACNQALKLFADVVGDAREVVFLPGPGEGRNLTGDRQFAHDWWFNCPTGLHRGGVPTLTVYVSGVAPAMPPDAKQLAQWISDLDSETFATRDQASKEIKKLGYAASPALRKALADASSAEVRKRIEILLGELSGVDLQHVKVPAGVKVLEAKDLLKRHREGLKGENPENRGQAAGALGGLDRYFDVVPDLVGVLKDEKHEYVRRCAAGALSRLGKKAAPALPLLKTGLDDPDVNIRNAFDYAIKQIEAAKEEKPDEERAKRQAALLKGIGGFREALPAEPKK